jgi:hypothetical protein
MPQIYGSSLPNYAAKFATSKSFGVPKTTATATGYGGQGGQATGGAFGMNPADRAEEAWKTANDLMLRPGPFTPEVTQQLVNRQADQSAAAEAVNADELRNLAAARGIDPTQALRQGQAQRQQSNIVMAAQANLQRSFGNQTAPAVQGGTAFSTARPAQSGGYSPAATYQPQQPMAFAPSKLYGAKTAPAPAAATSGAPAMTSVERANAAQAAWKASGGKPMGNPYVSGGAGNGYVTNGTRTISTAPPQQAQSNAIYRTPAQQTAFQASLNKGIQYTPGVPTKLPAAMFQQSTYDQFK